MRGRRTAKSEAEAEAVAEALALALAEAVALALALALAEAVVLALTYAYALALALTDALGAWSMPSTTWGEPKGEAKGETAVARSNCVEQGAMVGSCVEGGSRGNWQSVEGEARRVWRNGRD